MFTGLLPHQVTISRLQADAGANTSSFQTVSSTRCMLQPMDLKEAEMLGLGVGKAFKSYFDITVDIKEADKTVIDGTEYRVNGVSEYNFGNFKHKKVLIVREM